MIRVLLFAQLREQLGQPEIELAFVADESVAAMVERLIALHGENWRVLASPDTHVALNQVELAAEELSAQVLSEGDELAFFPPVTGG